VSLKGSFAIISHVLFYALTNRFVVGRKNRRVVLNFETYRNFTIVEERDRGKNSYTFANRQQKIMFTDENAPREIFTREAIFTYIESLSCENVCKKTSYKANRFLFYSILFATFI